MASPQSAPVMRCPVDVFRRILDLVSPGDILSLCRVSRDIRKLAEPTLYSAITFASFNSLKPPAIATLLRTILARRELGSHVRRLVVGGFYQTLQGGFCPIIRVTDADTRLPIAFVRKVGLPFENTLISALERGSLNAFLAVLLCQLPSLISLEISWAFANESSSLGQMLRYLLCDPARHNDDGLPTFRHLESVGFLPIMESTCEDHRCAGDVLPFFYLPVVQNLLLSIDHHHRLFAWPTERGPIASTITSLQIDTLRETHLGPVLAATPNLRMFKWYWAQHLGLGGSPVIDLDQLYSALAHVRHTLTELRIVGNWGSRSESQLKLEFKGSLKEMAGFKALEKISIPAPFLRMLPPGSPNTLHEVLPRDIRIAQITDDLTVQQNSHWTDRELMQLFKGWLTDWKVATPQLEKIYLVVQYRENEGDWLGCKGQLQEQGVEHGVEVIVAERCVI